MKKIIFIISFIAFSHSVFAQGFDWQYSSRLPFVHPKLFIGGNVSLGEIATTGSFSFLDK